MEKMYQKIISLFVALHLFASSVNAQINISPLATVTGSNCSTGPCSSFNDLNYGTCGTQQVWVSTGTPPSSTPGVDWIQWDWSNAESFDEITIHHASATTRFLTGGLIQTWNGTAWVNHHTFSNLPMQCVNTFTFPTATTNRMRITAFQMTGTGQLSNPNFREIEVFRAAPSAPNDAGVSELTSPLAFCVGSNDIKVKVKNYGTNLINNVQVQWSMDGVPQTPVNLTLPLDTVGGVGLNEREVTLTTGYNFTAGSISFKAWTHQPNNQNDTTNLNDTLELTLQPALSGIYTVNSALPTAGTNYNNFAALISDLQTLGVCAPVTVNVVANSGPYNERFYIGNIPGTSAVNKVRINGNGNTLQYNATTTDPHLLRITGTKYLTIDNLIFKSTNVNYGWGAHFMNGTQYAEYDSITNCTFDLTTVTGSSTTYCNGITFSGSLTSPTTAGSMIAKHCYIGGNQVLGAPNSTTSIYYGMTLMTGADSNTIEGNIFSNYYVYGLYMGGTVGHTKILNNTFHRADKPSTTTFYGIYSTGARSQGLEIVGNRIHTPGGVSVATGTSYAIYISSSNVPAPYRLFIANNAIYNFNQGGTVYGIYVITGGVNTKIVHNTLDFAYPLTGTNYAMYLSGSHTNGELKNNMVTFTATGSGAQYGYYHATTNGFPAANVQRNNIWRGNAPAANTYHSYHGGNRLTLADLQTAYPAMEVGSLSVNPMYLSASTGDFEPTNGTLLNNGLNLSGQVPTDINGATRATLPTPGAFEMPPPVPNNARMLGIPAPVAFCAGVNNVVVNVNNPGTNNITSLQVHWTINGVPQTPYNWTGNLAPSTSTNITIGNYNFLTGILYNIKAWTYLPNGVPDQQPSNDTFTVTRRSSLSGNFTINSAAATGGTNYQNFNDFSNDLNEFGVCGPVIAEVVVGSGPYTERVQFGDIPGASNVNTIRIHGNGQTIRFNSTSTADMPIVTLNGTKHMTIDSLHIQVMNPNFGWGVHIFGGAAHDSIKRCFIDLSVMTTSSSTNACGVALSGSNTSPTTAGNASDIYIGDNRIVGGANNSMYGAYYLVSINATIGTSGPNTGANNITVHNNEISNFYFYGIRAYGLNNGRITNNDIHKKNRTVVTGSTYAIYAYYFQGGEVSGNRMHDFSTTGVSTTGTFYGIITYNYYNTINTPVYIYNNAIYNQHTYTGTNYALYFNTSKFTHMYHNTVNFNAIQTSANTLYAIYMPTSTITEDCSLINNNITFTGGTTGTKYGIYVSSSLYNVEMQKNNVYFNTTQAGPQYWGYYGVNYATLTAFQTAYPLKEIGSLENDPLYVDEMNGNMQPQNLLFYENGDNVFSVVPVDIYGYERTTTPTPGAFEIGPCDVFNTGAKLLVTPTGSYCSGTRTFQVQIENGGLNDIDSVWVYWTFNGLPQPPVHYIGTITNRNTAPFNTAIVLLGDVFVPWGINSNVAIWTATPNGVLDKCNSNDTLITQINPATTIPTNLGPDTLICDGYELVLSAGPQTGYIYKWDDNSTANQRSVYGAGTYYVLKSDPQLTCTGHDTIVVTTNPTPTVDLGPDSAVCPGNHVILDAGVVNLVNDILWDDNSTGQYRDIHLAGTYSVTVTNEFGCQDHDEYVLSYRDIPATDGINAVYMLDMTYNFNLVNPQYVAEVIWDFGDGSPVDTGFFVTHKYKKHGLYKVSVLMISSCDGGDPMQYSVTLDAIGLGLNEVNPSDLKLYPNPSTEKLTIEVSSAKIQEISVSNVLGQTISVEKVNYQSKHELNVSGLSSGMYTLKVITDKGHLIRKFEVVK